MVEERFYKEVLRHVNYNPITGLFTWNKYRSRNAKKGDVAGSLGNRGYLQIGVTIGSKKKKLLAHRIAWYCVNKSLPNIIDHIDCNKLNNKINNLRVASQSQNAMNKPNQANNKSGMRGVCWDKKRNKWYVYININKKRRHLGRFDSYDDAVQIRLDAEKEFFKYFRHGVNG